MLKSVRTAYSPNDQRSSLRPLKFFTCKFDDNHCDHTTHCATLKLNSPLPTSPPPAGLPHNAEGYSAISYWARLKFVFTQRA